MSLSPRLLQILPNISDTTLKGEAIKELALAINSIHTGPLTVQPITVPDATDEASAITLVNACKATLNALILELGGGNGGA